jgi:hypothetical protein
MPGPGQYQTSPAVYTIHLSTGEYEDHREADLGYVLSEDQAKKVVEEINNALEAQRLSESFAPVYDAEFFEWHGDRYGVSYTGMYAFHRKLKPYT